MGETCAELAILPGKPVELLGPPFGASFRAPEHDRERLSKEITFYQIKTSAPPSLRTVAMNEYKCTARRFDLCNTREVCDNNIPIIILVIVNYYDGD